MDSSSDLNKLVIRQLSKSNSLHISELAFRLDSTPTRLEPILKRLIRAEVIVQQGDEYSLNHRSRYKLDNFSDFW